MGNGSSRCTGTNRGILFFKLRLLYFKGLVFHSTRDIIQAAKEDRLPDKIMITIHPQRRHDKPLPWIKELIWQNAKNVVKRIVIMKN